MDNIDMYNQLSAEGHRFLQNQDLDRAILKWEEARELNPDDFSIYSTLSRAYKAKNNLNKSCSLLSKAIELKKDDFTLIYRYALLLFENKQYNKSIDYLIKAASMDPENISVINDLGVLYFYKKDFNQAINYFQKALNLDNSWLDSIINLIKTYLELKDYDLAGKSIEKYFELYPGNYEIQKMKEFLNHIRKNDPVEEKIGVELEFSGNKYQIDPIEIYEFDIKKDRIRSDIELSIVIPVMNEEENVPVLYKQLTDVLVDLKQNYEIIFVDDGSRDKTLSVLKSLSKKDSKLKIIEFRKNYGQTAAMSAGFKYAHGSVIITMDGDLQNDPEDIPRLLEKMAEGYDLVSGWRKDRQDKALTRVIPSKIANKIINKLISGTGIQLNDYGCTLKAYKRGIIKNIKLYGEMHRFIPAFAAWLGVKVTEIPVKHHPRKFGYAKYNLSRVSRVIFDLIVVRFFGDYLTRPIQFFGKIAKNLVGSGIVVLFILSLINISWSDFPIDFNTLLILFGLLCFSGLQLLIMGLLGEIMMRIYFEGQDKDAYIIEKIIQKN